MRRPAGPLCALSGRRRAVAVEAAAGLLAQRALGREQQKITAWQQKRKAENAARAASKQPPLDENEWQKLFKLPVEPSRLEALLVGRQVEQYARQVDGFSATVSAKMFGVKGNLLPNEIE